MPTINVRNGLWAVVVWPSRDFRFTPESRRVDGCVRDVEMAALLGKSHMELLTCPSCRPVDSSCRLTFSPKPNEARAGWLCLRLPARRTFKFKIARSSPLSLRMGGGIGAMFMSGGMRHNVSGPMRARSEHVEFALNRSARTQTRRQEPGPASGVDRTDPSLAQMVRTADWEPACIHANQHRCGDKVGDILEILKVGIVRSLRAKTGKLGVRR